mgnify:CR=1 FL=1
METIGPEIKVSIALATYNGGQYLREQLESIASQTELPSEVVISDDGSNDDTLKIVAAFSRQAPFDVRVLPRHDRLGFADNFLHAAEHCRNPVVMFCDQDDVWLPEKLAVSRRRLTSDNSLALIHSLSMVDGDLKPIGPLSQGITASAVYQPLELDPFLCAYGNTLTFRRELLSLRPRNARPPADERSLSHDTWIYTLAAALGRVTHLAESYILYRQHGENASNLDPRNRWQKLVDLGTFNVRHHNGMAQFKGQMAKIFEDISLSQPEWAQRAKVAAERYRQRRQDELERIHLYSAPSLQLRVSAFRSVHMARWSAPGPVKNKLFSSSKDFTLGVLKLGARVT